MMGVKNCNNMGLMRVKRKEHKTPDLLYSQNIPDCMYGRHRRHNLSCLSLVGMLVVA